MSGWEKENKVLVQINMLGFFSSSLFVLFLVYGMSALGSVGDRDLRLW